MLELFRLLGGSDSDENSQDVAPKRPRRSMVDPAAWDQFWHDELTRGTAAFVDMFCSEGRLIDAMRANRLKTVLCVGNGISQEPRALARAGFDVTALDLSPFATRMAAEVGASDELLAHLLDGRSPRWKGRVQFVTGDLGDSTVCPGPYDVVIERKTLQLFPDDERPAALRAVTNRVASPGIFFSQTHRGGQGRPTFPIADWLNAEGWPRWRSNTPLTGRTAWLFSTSG